MVSEVADETARLAVGEHAVDLGEVGFFIGESSFVGELAESFVRHGAPEEIREARGDGVIVQFTGSLLQIEKIRGAEGGLVGRTHGILEAVFFLNRLVRKGEAALEFRFFDRAAVGGLHEISQETGGVLTRIFGGNHAVVFRNPERIGECRGCLR